MTYMTILTRSLTRICHRFFATPQKARRHRDVLLAHGKTLTSVFCHSQEIFAKDLARALRTPPQ